MLPIGASSYGAIFGWIPLLIVGSALGIAIVKAVHGQGIDAVTVPTKTLVFLVILAGVFGVIAAIGPGARAARLNVLEAIATE